MKKLKLIKTASKATANVFCVLFGVVMTTSVIANANSTMVSTFLGAKTQEIISKNDGERGDVLYHKTDFESIEELKANGEKLCEDIVAEGVVLMKNNGALPLSGGAQISLFGSGSTNFVFAGGGSSYSPSAETRP